MKKYLLSLFAFACLCTASAESYMFIEQKGKPATKYKAVDVEEVTFEEEQLVSSGDTVSGVQDGYEYVDLGLPSGIMWATYNVGATNSREIGNFYTWGETETKEDYNEYNYKWFLKGKKPGGITTSLITKYSVDERTTHPDYEVDSITTLLPEDDAASVIWKGKWRMPTAVEFAELRNNCDFEPEYDADENVIGVVATSMINGNIVYFPMGDSSNNTDFNYYWTASLMPENSHGGFDAVAALLASSGYSIYSRTLQRDNAAEIRAVFQGERKPEIITYMTVHLANGETEKYDIEEVKDVRFYEVDDDFGVTVSGKIADYEYVDLGLEDGTLWAVYNVGATSPTSSNSYFAFGETETKDVYADITYKWASEKWKANPTALFETTKYTGRIPNREGFIDGLTELLPEDDAATANWGEDWVTPSMNEWKTLYNSCDWVWMENFNDSGVDGMLGTSKNNGNTLFLPDAGYRQDDELYDTSLLGRTLYMTSTIDVMTNSGYANLDATIERQRLVTFNAISRSVGKLVRPVAKKK